MTHPLLESTLAKCLLFLRLPETGASAYWQLQEQGLDIEALLEKPPASQKPYLRPVAIEALAGFFKGSALTKRLEQDLSYIASQPDLHCLTFNHPLYPRLLREIPKPPPMLFVRGDPACLGLPQVAMVGSRNPTAGGLENAERFARYLAECGFAITSGLALGIDAAAHQGALNAKGKTVAVMGTGIDLIYPSRHRGLAQAILDAGGALVSEFPLGVSSQAANFPQRNRIISGLSGGTLVVEAAVQSGSLITASYALQHDREVFAIPGSIHNPLAKGCHQLIRQGATLVETAQDIVDQLTGLISFKRHEATQQPPTMSLLDRMPERTVRADTQSIPELVLDDAEQALLAALGFDPLPLDILAERTGADIGRLSAGLITLEIKGLVQQIGACYQRI